MDRLCKCRAALVALLLMLVSASYIRAQTPIIEEPNYTPTLTFDVATIRLAPPPDANRRFEDLLGQGQMWQRGTDDPQQAIELCADLAHGGSPQPYIDGTLKKSPQLLPQEARQVVEDAIVAYCPQYANR